MTALNNQSPEGRKLHGASFLLMALYGTALQKPVPQGCNRSNSAGIFVGAFGKRDLRTLCGLK